MTGKFQEVWKKIMGSKKVQMEFVFIAITTQPVGNHDDDDDNDNIQVPRLKTNLKCNHIWICVKT